MSKWVLGLVGLMVTLALVGSACTPAAETTKKEKLVLAVQPTATPEKLAAEAKDIEFWPLQVK